MIFVTTFHYIFSGYRKSNIIDSLETSKFLMAFTSRSVKYSYISNNNGANTEKKNMALVLLTICSLFIMTDSKPLCFKNTSIKCFTCYRIVLSCIYPKTNYRHYYVI